MENKTNKLDGHKFFGFYVPMAMTIMHPFIAFISIVTIWNFTTINLQFLLTMLIFYFLLFLFRKQYFKMVLSELLDVRTNVQISTSEKYDVKAELVGLEYDLSKLKDERDILEKQIQRQKAIIDFDN